MNIETVNEVVKVRREMEYAIKRALPHLSEKTVNELIGATQQMESAVQSAIKERNEYTWKTLDAVRESDEYIELTIHTFREINLYAGEQIADLIEIINDEELPMSARRVCIDAYEELQKHRLSVGWDTFKMYPNEEEEDFRILRERYDETRKTLKFIYELNQKVEEAKKQ